MVNPRCVSSLCLFSVAVLAAAFHHPWLRNSICQRVSTDKQSRRTPLRVTFWSWLGERLDQSLEPNAPRPFAQEGDKDRTSKPATVLRAAARKYSGQSSMPSSRNYTTRKDEFPSLHITTDGVVDDYNHYRTVALKSTPDRALSILTQDVVKALKTAYPSSQAGDLGENILVDGISFRDLAVGQTYEFTSGAHQSNGGGGAATVQITEPMVPCMNLCKLPWINSPDLQGKARIERCQGVLEFLDRADGFRGWYAKVLTAGEICVGDTFQMVGAPS